MRVRRLTSRIVVGLCSLLVAQSMWAASASAAASGPGSATSSEFLITPADLTFILKQIKIAEAHATTETRAGTSVYVPGSTRATDVPDPTFPWGLRQVDGRNNNLTAGKATIGAADTYFPRVTTPEWRGGVTTLTQSLGSGTPASYSPSGSLYDPAPRTISNLAVVCRSCDQAVRVGFRLLEDGRKVRFCKHCNEAID